jgi:type VI secretion system protein ImpA
MPDVEALLAETAVMPPGGIDLEYDLDYLQFEALTGDKPDRQFDSNLEEPPWREVMERAASLLAKSKDLRVAIAYTRAAAHLQGLPGFLAGLSLLNGLLARYWDVLYPPLDIEDNNDATLRVNALAALADPYTPFTERTTLLHDLRLTEICRTSSGTLRVRDILIAHHKYAAAEGETALTPKQVLGLLGEARTEQHAALVDALALPGAVEEVSHRLTECFGANDAPGMTAMMSIAQTVAAACRDALGNEAEDIAPAVAGNVREEPREPSWPVSASGGLRALANESAQAMEQSMNGGFPRNLGAPATRQDVIAMLEVACAFIERTEPTNPAPLLIRRAKALMEKDFMAIMADLAPDGLAQIHLIAGTRPE